jgi:hypothetical protein
MDGRAVRAFLDRDRERVERAKREHHAERHRSYGGASGMALGQALREHARRVRPDWPTASERADDLAAHIALKRKLDRAVDAFSGR